MNEIFDENGEIKGENTENKSEVSASESDVVSTPTEAESESGERVNHTDCPSESQGSAKVKTKKEERIEKVFKYLKKPYVAIPLALVFAAIVVAIFSPYFAGNKQRAETNCYLNEMCVSNDLSLQVTSAEYADSYLTESGANYSSKTIIRVYGAVMSDSTKSKTVDSDILRLETADGKEIRPKSCVFTDTKTIDFDRVSLYPKSGVIFMAYYLVDSDVYVEDCRLLFFDNAIAFTERPPSM